MVTNLANVLSKKRERTCQKIIQALQECNGLLTLAAHKAGVSYGTVKRYASEFPSVQEAKENAKENMLDFCEGKLFLKIKENDLIAILFYLKTQGKKRGYIERQEIEHGGNIGLRAEDYSDEELIGIVEGRSRRGTIKTPLGSQSLN